MDAASIVLALAAAGVNFGWQPASDSAEGYEYIVQVEPELLDALRRGEAVPIESNVPPEVGPIHKVSLVVGRGDLPRRTVGAVQRTAYFAGQPGWTPDRAATPPASGSAYDRYALPATATPGGVSPPPGVLERAQTAVTETGTALRDGVEAGIRAANQQFSRAGDQMLDATRNAGQEFGRQLQGLATDPVGQLQSNANSLRGAADQALGSAGSQRQQVANPFAASSPPAAATRSPAPSGVAPPPWPPVDSRLTDAPAANAPVDATLSRGMTPTRTASGWTSIGNNVAAPPLIVPPLAVTPANNSPAPLRTASGGPSFPVRAESIRDTTGAVETQPPRQDTSATDANDWASGWGADAGTARATIGRADNAPPADGTARGSDLVPVQPLNVDPQTSQQAASRWADPWATDPWAQPPQTTPPGSAAENAGTTGATRNAAAEWRLDANPSAMDFNLPANQLPAGNANNAADAATGAASPQSAAPAGADPALSRATAEQPPWLPLLVVSLSLMGSLSANLFLGWSYLDARQKYRSLVRKTADTFRRVTTAAA